MDFFRHYLVKINYNPLKKDENSLLCRYSNINSIEIAFRNLRYQFNNDYVLYIYLRSGKLIYLLITRIKWQ